MGAENSIPIEYKKNCTSKEEIKILKKGDGRLWRTVPKRRWQVRYSKKKLKSNKEVLLVYKYKNGTSLNEI